MMKWVKCTIGPALAKTISCCLNDVYGRPLEEAYPGTCQSVLDGV